jgi:hypothetical protein
MLLHGLSRGRRPNIREILSRVRLNAVQDCLEYIGMAALVNTLKERSNRARPHGPLLTQIPPKWLLFGGSLAAAGSPGSNSRS